MALETTVWDIQDYLKDPKSIFYYLEAELEANQPPYAAQALEDVIQARGGVEKLAAETGLSLAVLRHSVAEKNRVDRETLTRVMEAFRPAAVSATRVA